MEIPRWLDYYHNFLENFWWLNLCPSFKPFEDYQGLLNLDFIGQVVDGLVRM